MGGEVDGSRELRWVAPRRGALKLNSDGAFAQGRGVQGACSWG